MVEHPHTIFSEHIADLDKQLQSTRALLKALEMQKEMLVKQEAQMITYREYLIDNPQPPYLQLEQ